MQSFTLPHAPIGTVVTSNSASSYLCQFPLLPKHGPVASLSAISQNNDESIASPTYLNTPTESLLNMSIKAVGSTTTVLVSGAFFVVLAWKRDALMVSFFIGAIANGILSKVLKKLINQTRPPELLEQAEKDKDFLKPNDNGMPSSHAMSLGFLSTFIACNLPPTRIALAVYAIVSLMYRVQVKLHTWHQVVVGSILGSFNGWAWFCLCTGDNTFQVNIMNMLAATIIDEATGKLPLPYMIVPFVVGAATIGSFERRIGAWIKPREKSS